MALPKPTKPAALRRRRNRPADDWTYLPAEGCRERVPAWPAEGKAPAMWARLWKLPVAVYWHAQGIDPHVVAGYVIGWEANPTNTTVARMASELGLTPAGMLRLRLAVAEDEVDEVEDGADPYGHLRGGDS